MMAVTPQEARQNSTELQELIKTLENKIDELLNARTGDNDHIVIKHESDLGIAFISSHVKCRIKHIYEEAGWNVSVGHNMEDGYFWVFYFTPPSEINGEC